MPTSSSCTDGVWVQLVPQFQRDYDEGTTKGFRLRIDCIDSCGIDENIFRYYMKPATSSRDAESMFSGVCSWPDMEELPIGEPADDTSPAAFRLDYIDIVVSSETIATEVWTLIKEHADELVQTVKDGETLEEETEYFAVAS